MLVCTLSYEAEEKQTFCRLDPADSGVRRSGPIPLEGWADGETNDGSCLADGHIRF